MKPTKATLQKRLEEILEIRLSGATFFDARRYLAEKEAAGEEPWTIPDGGRPVSERTLWRYLQQVDRMIAQTCREGRKRRIRLHIARRHNLYAKSVAQGDMRAALAVLRDLAELQGDYPSKKTELTGKAGGPIVLNITEEVTGKEAPVALDAIVEEVVTHDPSSASPDDPPPSGPESVPVI